MKPVYDVPDTRECFNNHMGYWAVEPMWFAMILAQYRAGEKIVASGSGMPLYTVDDSGIAVVSIDGPMQKGMSKFGGTSTVATRRAIRTAANDNAVNAIMIRVDSPGGNVAGNSDLADDVNAAAAKKPIHAYVEDSCCSAAYWVASQASRITSNATAMVGSIGTYCCVEDSSGAAEKAGIKMHVVSSGEYKGLGTPGTPVTDAALGEVKSMVDQLNDHFLQGVKRGRKMGIEQVRKLADGRVHIAEKAQELGLIDGIQSFDRAMSDLRQAVKDLQPKAESRSRRARADVNIRLAEDS